MKPINVVREVFSWVKAIIIAVVISIVVTMFLVQPYSVSGSSMEPTLTGQSQDDPNQVGDRVIVIKKALLLGNGPDHGDMVIIDSRIDEKRSWLDDLRDSPIISVLANKDKGSNDQTNIWIKRVIGEPGDILEIRDGYLYRNNEKLEESYIKEKMNYPFERMVVPEGTVFVMGDNRNFSSDSREIGPVPLDHIVGEVVMRMYPFKKFELF
ncbi:signal peptidase I [Litchfieldia salsa]|uniref:Signal peptidase I n=1 Tax=Litchfieldia salsa TaxID=930152 RepID=A0A1H0U1R6_9BACI|nr:signal peptidase I [Litchfieldia salsa]SDP59908.1 signal peptidase I [Litchfieldia salsa]